MKNKSRKLLLSFAVIATLVIAIGISNQSTAQASTLHEAPRTSKNASHKKWVYHSHKYCKKHHVTYRSKKAVKKHNHKYFAPKHKMKYHTRKYCRRHGIKYHTRKFVKKYNNKHFKKIKPKYYDGTPLNDSSTFTAMDWVALPTRNAKVYVQPTTPLYTKAINESIHRWNQTGVVKIKKVSKPGWDVCTIKTGLWPNAWFDGIEYTSNLLKPISDKSFPYWTGVGGNIKLNTSYLMADSNQENNYTYTLFVVQHELGHYLGLGHNSYPTSIMQPAAENVTKVGLPDVNALARYFHEPLMTQQKLDKIQSKDSDAWN